MAGTDALCAVRWLAATYSRWRRLYTGIRRAEAKQRPLPFCCAQTRPLGEAPRPEGFTQTMRDVEGRSMVSFLGLLAT